ncbi:MAG: sulfite exporter TauE/SafE family protein [Planctomycetota bacterium]|nr:sulfite exporter TauE/SafE family protein [Planctomycetota bacterium]
MLQILEMQIWTIQVWEILILLGIGIIAGLAGGLLGIGGAVVNIPAISLLIGRDIHLAQAAAMNVTFFVALPSAIRHYREGGLNVRLLKIAAPTAIVAIIGGVFLSGVIANLWMQRIFGAFLIYVIVVNILKLIPGRHDSGQEEARVNLRRGMALGGISGVGAGLLGIGGGLLNVPLSQKICHLSLPAAIATSSAIMCFTSIIGAITKDATLPLVPITLNGQVVSLPWYEPFKYAIWLIPTCVFGSWFGAKLTHALPLKTVRIIFLVVVAAAALKMLW